MPKVPATKHRKRYSNRLAGSINDKLRIVNRFHPDVKTVLDVGCNDGSFTMAMAQERPDIRFFGIDNIAYFVKDARENQKKLEAGGVDLSNVDFLRRSLRDMLETRSQSFDVVVFSSVLHEFYSYGEGISSVVKALADAHELLKPNGQIVIRDMLLPEYMHTAPTYFNGKIGPEQPTLGRVIGAITRESRTTGNWERRNRMDEFFKMDEDPMSYYVSTQEQLNHYLLKSLYEDNWEHEMKEHYTAISCEKAEQILSLLGMQVEYRDTYLLEYLANRWKEMFGLDDVDLSSLFSTTLLSARKV